MSAATMWGMPVVAFGWWRVNRRGGLVGETTPAAGVVLPDPDADSPWGALVLFGRAVDDAMACVHEAAGHLAETGGLLSPPRRGPAVESLAAMEGRAGYLLAVVTRIGSDRLDPAAHEEGRDAVAGMRAAQEVIWEQARADREASERSHRKVRPRRTPWPFRGRLGTRKGIAPARPQARGA